MSKKIGVLVVALAMVFSFGTLAGAAPEDTIVIGSGAEAVGLDPRLETDVPSFERINVIIEPLVTFNTDMELVERLATDWEFSDDGMTLSFWLREGVVFHDGEPFTAEDVKYTFEWVLDEDNAAPNRALYADIGEIEIEDDYTIHFHLDELNSFLLNNMARMPIVPAHHGDRDDFRENPVGTGPYAFEDWTRDDVMNLAAFDDYWGGEPIHPYVQFRAIPEGSTRLLAFEAGEIDMYQGGVVPQELPRLEDDPNIIVERTPGTGYNYLGMNNKSGPLAEKEMRQALSRVINREGIVERVLNGIGEPGISPVPPDLPWFTDDVYDLSYDVEAAREILEEKGLFGEDITLELYTNENPERIRIAEILQFEAARVGIDVEITIEEWGAYLSRIQDTDDYDIFILGWVGQLDPDRAMYRQFHTDGPNNYTFFSNERLDELLEKGRTLDPASQESIDLYKEAQQIVVENAPYGFINYSEEVLLYHPHIEGITVHPYAANSWQDVHLIQKD